MIQDREHVRQLVRIMQIAVGAGVGGFLTL